MDLIIKRIASPDRHTDEYALQEYVPYGLYISMQGPARGGLLVRFCIDYRQTAKDDPSILALLKAAVAAYEAKLAAKPANPHTDEGE